MKRLPINHRSDYITEILTTIKQIETMSRVFVVGILKTVFQRTGPFQWSGRRYVKYKSKLKLGIKYRGSLLYAIFVSWQTRVKRISRKVN